MSAAADTILVVDDEPANLAVLADLLEPAGYALACVREPEEALRLAPRIQPILILLDVVMPGLDGLSVCRRLRAEPATAHIPIIFITGAAALEARVEGFRSGGVDYITKPIEAEEVLARVRTHVGLAQARRELAARHAELAASLAELREATARREAAEEARRDADARLSALSAREARRWRIAGLLGRSPALAAMLREVEHLQGFGRIGVLLRGESGTGKELVARALHSGSPRAEAPFIPVNCVAVPAELMESMFFGHVRGAFTGATADRKGFFELAHRGTLFLDEIGDMPAALQAKLLRALEDGCVTPVGASTERTVDVRVIAATNADLEARIAAGTFRADLYFRLARTTLRLPPLRERREDIALLAAHFVTQTAEEFGIRPVPELAPATLAALERYDFPGNVRELRNLIENAVIVSRGGRIEPAHVRLPPSRPPLSSVPASAPASVPADHIPLNLAAAEQMLIRRAVSRCGGNIAEAARLLGIHRSRIYRTFGSDDAARQESAP